MALCFSGTSLYRFDETTSNWNAVFSNLVPTEVNGELTRWDFAVYKNVIYMCDGVNPYCSYDTGGAGNFAQHGLTAIPTPSFDAATDTVTSAAHTLSNGDEVLFSTTGTMPAGLEAYRVYYVVNVAVNTFKVSNTPGGTAIDFTTNGTGTFSGSLSAQARVRYLQYMGDRVFGAGQDLNPNTLYYTAAAPANALNIETNALVVGGDEIGRINGIRDMGSEILVMKNRRWYDVDVATPSATPIDAENGGYSNRSVRNVNNSIFYFNDDGINQLNRRQGTVGGQSLQAAAISEDLRELTDLITPLQYNANCGWFDRVKGNYYFSFDTNGDNVPDTTIVWSSIVGSWSQYEIPNVYDYGEYIDSEGNSRIVAASANGGQMWELETDYYDNGTDIDYELETKNFFFGQPGLWKTVQYVDIIGYKSEGQDVTVSVKIDGEVVAQSILTDAFLNTNASAAVTLGTSPIGLFSTGGGAITDTQTTLTMYPYVMRVPLYGSGTSCSVNMYSEEGPIAWTFDKLRIGVE